MSDLCEEFPEYDNSNRSRGWKSWKQKKNDEARVTNFKYDSPRELSSEVCAICLDYMFKAKKAELDCCDHLYCIDCITKWVVDQSNRCP